MPEEDYEAIEAAVMETARGRWFLMEFARRNRNADTTVLLEAISRLEHQMTDGKNAPTTPHGPVTSTALVTSAKAELFAVEPPPPATAVAFPALPEPPELAWVDEPEVVIDRDKPIHGDIFHLDDDLILPAEPVQPAPPAGAAPAAPPPAPKPAEPPRAQVPEPQAPAQSRMLAGALASAGEAMARASEPAPPPPPSTFSPPAAEPAELDALSFEEKSVYFG
ncbi:hypothetical protein IZ6_20800 [Terrihabitans soli]|uniref:Uncharacterized protein n=1 Tax=Terrihabitans soli TaxID=708113 RepID=A0A6S6QUU9_9HYPH|nr:hypothetical protein IZ6_20800 [Terrihabitans soli]